MLVFGLRIGFAALGIAALQLIPITVLGGDWLELLDRRSDPLSQLLSVWQRWDALWYERIVRAGYQPGDGTAAFYPLYPLLSWLVARTLGGQVVLALLLVSTCAYLVALWLLFRLARLDLSPDEARLSVLLLALFPTGFFFLAPYTESLFLVLSVAAFWFARTDRPVAAGAVAFGAALTRGFGALLALPLAYEHVRQRRAAGRSAGLSVLWAGLPLLGYLAAFAYQVWLHGEAGSPTGVMLQFWGQQIVPPWQALADSWDYLVSRGDPIEVLNLVSLLGFCLLAVIAARRLPLSYWLYLWPYLALLLTRIAYFSPLMSAARYLVVLFPCFMVLATFLARRGRVRFAWLGLSLLLEVLLFVRWVHFGFVG